MRWGWAGCAWSTVPVSVEPPPPDGPLWKPVPLRGCLDQSRGAGSALGKGAQPAPGWTRGPQGGSLTLTGANTRPPAPCGRLKGGRPAGEGPPLVQPAVSLTGHPHNPSPKPPVPSRPGTEGRLLRHRAFAAAAARPAHTSSPRVTQEAEQQAGKSDKLGCTKAFPLPHSSPRRVSGLAWKDRGASGAHGWPVTPCGSVTTGGVATLGWATCQTGRGTCSLLFCLNTLQRFLSGP